MNLHQLFFGSWGVALWIYSAAAFCQTSHANTPVFGLSGSFTALTDAGRWNPANLGLRRTLSYSLYLASFSAGVYNNAFSKTDYDLYNGAYLTSGHKTEILKQIPAEGWRFNAGGAMDLVGFSHRNYALAVGIDVAADARLARDFLDLLLNGNKLNRRYDFSGTAGAGMAMLTIGFSHGKSIRLPVFLKPHLRKLAVGVTIKYLRGLQMAEVLNAGGSMITTFDGISGNAQARVRRANGGNGLALDFGVASIVNKNLSLGLTLRNFPAIIHWGSGTKENAYGVTADSLTAAQLASTNEDSVIQQHSRERGIAGFFNSLPVVIHLRAVYQQGQMLLSGELVQGFENHLNASTTPELRMGMEGYFIDYLLPRFGFSLGGKCGIRVALGLGFTTGSFRADIAAGTWGGLLPAHSKGIGFAFGMNMRL
ncbi:MAG: DUF5723 family protein [candidate division KSB1 bacterium]|nr:DUF5723 family protein [candidate division KSB1 bacterium]MDZ7302905.1 DUF5723 family protein [candidate division KSB1 bacterium]MDZ7310480.1 DUF5723 family protein [candidate division KSB1 bacterium]